MEYVVTNIALYGKEPGAKFTEKELLDAGANIQKYLQSGRLKKATKEATNVPKAQPVIQQVQKEEPKAPVFNLVNNEGDK